MNPLVYTYFYTGANQRVKIQPAPVNSVSLSFANTDEEKDSSKELWLNKEELEGLVVVLQDMMKW